MDKVWVMLVLCLCTFLKVQTVSDCKSIHIQRKQINRIIVVVVGTSEFDRAISENSREQC